ncbi:MAG: protein kinase [Acidobacteriota bacterium]|jgi:Flp pilus assembly protein TadD/TolB-like protein|nr:protein kinase [Acidobacteriota bacterium]
MIGRTLLHYEILEKLGEGGMGEVWLARDTRLDREVAIKVLSPEVAADPERLERFRREAKAVAALNHPNIVTIHSVEEENDVPFFTMEYVEGETLSRIIPKEGLDPLRFLNLAIPITDAVSAAHENGITHRDLKPGNIMVSGRGQLKVLDFGLAKVSREESKKVHSESHLETEFLTSEGQVLGTTPYMSPEQLKGKPVDQRSDIFSLGTILYAMATGKHPFLADSSAEVISSILSHHPPEVSEIKDGLPDYLSGVIRRCLEKEPEDRYPSARGLEDDLVRLRDGIHSGSWPQTVVISDSVKTGRRAIRVPRWALAAVAVVATLIAGAIVIGKVGSKPPAPLRTMAVMPFANLTGDAELDQLAEGVSAGLANQLREKQGLQVLRRSEAWNVRDRSPGELAGELGVGSVVDGEILKEGSRLETTVSLTDTATGMVLWSHTYSAPGGEIYGLQRIMAGDLATFLSIPLSEDDRWQLAHDPQGADQALDYYVTGRGFLDRVDDLRGPDAAGENFRQALRLDPNFALAHVGLSEALWEVYLRDLDRVALEEAEDHAEKAREIAPEMPEARLALARIYRTTGRHDAAVKEVEAALADHPRADEVQRELGRSYERVGDLEAAERSLRAATSLRPDDWINWNVLGNFLARNGKYEEAGDAYRQSAEVAPTDVSMPREKLATYGLQVGEIDAAIDIYESLPKPIRSPRLASNLATAYFFSERPERWERAEENYLLAVRLNPQDSMYQANLGDLYQRLERPEEAQERYRLACDLLETRVADDPDDPEALSDLAFYSAKANDCGRAMTMTPRLEELLPDTGPSAHTLAYIYALCGESDDAVEALTKAIAHGESIELIRQEDEFRSLRDLPDFQALVGGVG